MGEKFNFRGSPKSNQDFYMLAILSQSKITEFKTQNNGNFSSLGESSDKYFFLCQNEYTEGGEKFHRLYWSSDPDDFQPNYGQGFNNQGVVRVNYNSNSNTKPLRYRTVFNKQSRIRHPEPGVYNNFSPNLNTLTGDENSFGALFTSNFTKNLNTDTKVYYSLPYNISNYQFGNINIQGEDSDNSLNRPINWIFRKIKNQTVASDTVTVPKPTSLSYSSNIFNFVDMKNLNTTSGTGDSFFNYGSVKYTNVNNLVSGTSFYTTDTVLTLDSYPTEFSDFPKAEGNIMITNNTTSDRNVIFYDRLEKDGNQSKFYINSSSYNRGLIGQDFNVESGTSINITFNERNDKECFTILGSGIDFSDFFDIYLIPTENNAFFPGGYTINDTNQFPICYSSGGVLSAPILTPISNSTSGENLNFFNHISRSPNTDAASTLANPNDFIDCNSAANPQSINLNKLVNYKKIYNLLVFFLINSLNSSYWTSSSFSGFPQIARDSYPITFFTWDVYEDARNSYMYNYCNLTSRCGFCYGRNDKGHDTCLSDALTKKHASLTSSSNVMVPLTGESRSTGSNNTGGNPTSYHDTGMIVMGVVLGIVILIFSIVLYKCETK